MAKIGRFPPFGKQSFKRARNILLDSHRFEDANNARTSPQRDTGGGALE